MQKNTFKKLFDALPFGVLVFDEKLHVKFINAAFRRSFPVLTKNAKTLSSAISCGEIGDCGNAKNCEYCAFYRVMRATIDERTEKTETAITTVRRDIHTDTVSVRIKAYPVDNSGKLFIMLTDGSFASEMEREMLSAQRMQQRLLPAGKSMGGVPYSYMYIPCLGVGGDLPDVIYYSFGHK